VKPNAFAKMLAICIFFVGLILLLPRDIRDCKEQYVSDVTIRDTSHTMKLNAQLASTEIERELGLSGKKCISEHQAMLFKFDSPGYYGIWMKAMKFSIDIVWLDESKQVIDTKTNVTPDSFPQIYTPKSLSVYVVEVQGGVLNKYDIGVGSRLSW
jgi:hypothetical protein